MIIETDYIHPYPGKPIRFYRAICDCCGEDRGYKPRYRSKKLCYKCTNKRIAQKIHNIYKEKDKEQGIKRDRWGVAKYPGAKCCRCGKDRGYKRKTEKNKLCTQCANIEKKGILRGKFPYDDAKRRLKGRMANRMRDLLKKRNSSKGGVHVFDILGYSVDDLKNRLESLFVDGMNWDNMGKWHIDHILPDCMFGYKSVNDIDFKKCWSLDNLQPLWAEDNLSKGTKILTNMGDII